MRKPNSNNVDLKSITKESITQALLILMRDTPYNKISISAICQKAGVARSAFYRNYPAKDAILRVYLYEETDAWRRELHSNKTINNYQYFISLFTQCFKFKDIVRSMIAANLDYILVDLFIAFYRDLTKINKDSTFVQCHLAGSVYFIFINWVMNNHTETPEDIAKIVLRLNRIDPAGRLPHPPMSDIQTLMGDFPYKE